MDKRKYSYTQLGMLFGIFIGGGVGILLFVYTSNALSFTVIGIGLVIGLILGAGFDRQKGNKE